MLNGYSLVGNGREHVFFLNGWIGCAESWNDVVCALDPEALTAVLFDYRGYGKSIHLSGDYTFDQVCQDVLNVADHLQLPTFSLVGHSMGGMAMQKIAVAAPRRVNRMVAVTPVPACGSRMDAQRKAHFEQAVTNLAAREAIIHSSTGNRLPSTWVSRTARHSVEVAKAEATAAYLDEWTTKDFSHQVINNPTPVKVIVGEYDPGLTPALMEKTWLQWYPNANLELMRNAGHYPMNETPLALAASIQAFCAP